MSVRTQVAIVVGLIVLVRRQRPVVLAYRIGYRDGRSSAFAACRTNRQRD